MRCLEQQPMEFSKTRFKRVLLKVCAVAAQTTKTGAMASRTVANANAKWPVKTQNGNPVTSSDRFPVTTVHSRRDRLGPKPNCLFVANGLLEQRT